MDMKLKVQKVNNITFPRPTWEDDILWHNLWCFIIVKTLDVQMDLLILSFGELSETNMVRIDP